MPNNLILIFWIGGVLYLVGTPLIIWLLFLVKEKLNSLMSFREWFMTAYDFNEKTIEAIDKLDSSLKKKIFEISLQERDRLKQEIDDLSLEIEKSNKKQLNEIFGQLIQNLEKNDSKSRKDS